MSLFPDRPKTRLLILACCPKKVETPVPVPAAQLYRGVFHNCYRAALRRGYGSDIRLVILSAKYGLLLGDDLVLPYEQPMTPERALELEEGVVARLTQVAGGQRWESACVCMVGKLYLAMVRKVLVLRQATFLDDRYLFVRVKRFSLWLKGEPLDG
jgi:hypothetical protein